MEVRYDSQGQRVSDFEVEYLAKLSVENDSDVHTSNLLMVDALRAYLKQLPAKERPQVRWVFNGTVVNFNDDLKPDNWNSVRDIYFDMALKLL